MDSVVRMWLVFFFVIVGNELELHMSMIVCTKVTIIINDNRFLYSTVVGIALVVTMNIRMVGVIEAVPMVVL